MNQRIYSLPDLPYPTDALEPILSREQLSVHHDKHHQAYVRRRTNNSRNWMILEPMGKASMSG
jgi:superoxide dismutase